ncbi:S-adenosyl-L-methionine-dependent methyltransferase [Rickenella mellea]|uniref:rRNA adenine N(6)-methyltransferase n=1 Tax=Rickenella mellea TaxID=50990 RepID=A0A4Y7QBC8_9AGAM|nr:S-adenosyl-L-methionine-dependent methyltransferase [Rickenella mellea]
MARTLRDAFLKPVSAGNAKNPKVIIEAFPGPGALTRALLELPPSRLKRLIVMEESPVYLDYLKVLEAHDPRVKVVPLSGWAWSSYTEIEAGGLLNEVSESPWESGVHPNLHFISHIPNAVHGDQLLSQLFRCIPERSWLFKYGRVPLSLILAESLYERSSAPLKHKQRCKLSISASAVAEQSLVIPTSRLQPYADYFHPNVQDLRVLRNVGNPMVAANIYPLEKPLIDKGSLEIWDFVLRRLFVLKSTPLKKAITSLAPGANNLLKSLAGPDVPPNKRVDVNKTVKMLTLDDWQLIMQAFKEWPFAPDVS